MCDGIGDITASKLISHCGGAAAVFKEKSKHLSTIPGVADRIYDLLHSQVNWQNVQKEVDYITKNNLNHVSFTDAQYPQSLLKTDSPPVLLFFTGPIEHLNQKPCISIVGTRFATPYGVQFVDELLQSAKDTDLIVISGMAVGIDIAAHKASVRCGVPTFGIVAHGFDTFYPAIHWDFSRSLPNHNGGIVTEFFSGEAPNRENFPKRNRIIAGLSKATVVVEAAKKGGALITAQYARQYKRDLFVLPGRYYDKFSEGCNFLLKSKVARPIFSANELLSELGFSKTSEKLHQPDFSHLSEKEVQIINILRTNKQSTMDAIAAKAALSISDCATILFNMEMAGIVNCLPGKSYGLSCV